MTTKTPPKTPKKKRPRSPTSVDLTEDQIASKWAHSTAEYEVVQLVDDLRSIGPGGRALGRRFPFCCLVVRAEGREPEVPEEGSVGIVMGWHEDGQTIYVSPNPDEAPVAIAAEDVVLLCTAGNMTLAHAELLCASAEGADFQEGLLMAMGSKQEPVLGRSAQIFAALDLCGQAPPFLVARLLEGLVEKLETTAEKVSTQNRDPAQLTASYDAIVRGGRELLGERLPRWLPLPLWAELPQESQVTLRAVAVDWPRQLASFFGPILRKMRRQMVKQIH